MYTALHVGPFVADGSAVSQLFEEKAKCEQRWLLALRNCLHEGCIGLGKLRRHARGKFLFASPAATDGRLRGYSALGLAPARLRLI